MCGAALVYFDQHVICIIIREVAGEGEQHPFDAIAPKFGVPVSRAFDAIPNYLVVFIRV